MKNWEEQFDSKYISGELRIQCVVKDGIPLKPIKDFIKNLLSEQKREIIEELNKLDLFKGVDCWYDSLLEQYKYSDCIMCGTNPTRVKQVTKDIINIIKDIKL